MTAHFQTFSPRASTQTRPAFPFPDEPVHARAQAMADAMLDIAARGCGGATVAELVQLGFALAEITEHFPAAKTIADARAVSQARPAPDTTPDIVAKALQAVAWRPPMPRGAVATQAYTVDWHAYCRAVAALKLDPWPGQRERCLTMLARVLDRTELFSHMTADVLLRVGAGLRKVNA
jgi:hypothetical protein